MTLQKRKIIRLKHYDYSNPGSYFVTICSFRKQCLFGEIIESKVRLNALGEIIKRCWEEIPTHISGVRLDEFTIMPNHIHGIIVITSGRGEACLAPTTTIKHRPELADIIGSFKSAVSKNTNRNLGTKKLTIWQRNYYEHIVRNEEDLNKIRKYIENNPLQWALDEENPDYIPAKASS